MSSKNFILICMLSLPIIAMADGIQVKQARLESIEETQVLNADFETHLSPILEEALNKGVALHFIMELELFRMRWYWFDQKVLTIQQEYKLSYHALTRQYRLTIGSLYQNFSDLGSAMRILSRVRNLSVIENASLIKKSDKYEAALRLRLDVSQLPKPFQVNALTSKDWHLESDWYRWGVN